MTNENTGSYKNTSKGKVEEGNLIYAEDINAPSGRGMMKDLLNELNMKSMNSASKIEEEKRQE